LDADLEGGRLSIGKCRYCGEAFSASSRARLGAAISLHLQECPQIVPILPEGFVPLPVAAVRLGVSPSTVRRRGIPFQEAAVPLKIRVKLNALGHPYYCVADLCSLHAPPELPKSEGKTKRGRKRILETREERQRSLSFTEGR
jgi:hypothetical protein